MEYGSELLYEATRRQQVLLRDDYDFRLSIRVTMLTRFYLLGFLFLRTTLMAHRHSRRRGRRQHTPTYHRLFASSQAAGMPSVGRPWMRRTLGG